MKFSNVFNFRQFFVLCCLVGTIGFTVGVVDEVSAAKKKPVDVAEKSDSPTPGGCQLEIDEPLPHNQTPPCETGVPGTGPGVFSCPSVGTAPNKTCHWAFEDRLGCNNGGAGMMCDTVAVGGGTDCKCNPVP